MLRAKMGDKIRLTEHSYSTESGDHDMWSVTDGNFASNSGGRFRRGAADLGRSTTHKSLGYGAVPVR